MGKWSVGPTGVHAGTAVETKRHRPLSKVQRQFVELVHSGVKPALAAKVVGRCERTASRILKRPDVQKMLDEMARATLALAKGPAAHKLVGLMDSTSQKVQLDAAKHVLAISNIRPPDGPGTRVTIGIGAFPTRHVLTDEMSPEEVKSIKDEWANYGGPGYLIDWREDRDEPKQVEHAQSGGTDA
jgi:hypothetical protein